MDKPKKLYRGITLDFDKLKDFDFNGNIELPFLFKFREDGMKLVQDGNEYGIYMSDNIQMPLSAYGHSTIFDGIELDETVMFGAGKETVRIPPICIIYEINAENINIKEPWICPELKGHYNNGFEGKEWITQEPILAKNYRIATLKIGMDYLHPEEEIKIGPNDDVKKILVKKYSERNQRLNNFLKALSTIEPIKRLRMADFEVDAIKDLYKKDGLAYKNFNEIKITNKIELEQKLIAKQLSSKGYDRDEIRKIKFFCKKLDDENLYGSSIVNIQGKCKDIAIKAIELLIEEDLKRLGITYSHFTNNNAHIILDNYNIKLSNNGDVQITQFGENIKLEEILIKEDKISQNIKKSINLLEDLRLEKLNCNKNNEIENER